MPEATTNNQSNAEQSSARNGSPNQAYNIPKRRGSQYVDLLLQRIQKLEGLDNSPIIGVTSPSKRQGVSTVATNLAIRAADHFRDSVLLVDCNYVNQRTSRVYRCTGEGFGECVLGNLLWGDKHVFANQVFYRFFIFSNSKYHQRSN